MVNNRVSDLSDTVRITLSSQMVHPHYRILTVRSGARIKQVYYLVVGIYQGVRGNNAWSH